MITEIEGDGSPAAAGEGMEGSSTLPLDVFVCINFFGRSLRARTLPHFG